MIEVMEDSERSEEGCDLIREDFGSCSELEMMSMQPHLSEGARISRFVGEKIKERIQQLLGQRVSIQKIDLIRDPTSYKIKSLKAMVRKESQTIQLTADTGTPVSFLN